MKMTVDWKNKIVTLDGEHTTVAQLEGVAANGGFTGFTHVIKNFVFCDHKPSLFEKILGLLGFYRNTFEEEDK